MQDKFYKEAVARLKKAQWEEFEGGQEGDQLYTDHLEVSVEYLKEALSSLSRALDNALDTNDNSDESTLRQAGSDLQGVLQELEALFIRQDEHMADMYSRGEYR